MSFEPVETSISKSFTALDLRYPENMKLFGFKADFQKLTCFPDKIFKKSTPVMSSVRQKYVIFFSNKFQSRLVNYHLSYEDNNYLELITDEWDKISDLYMVSETHLGIPTEIIIHKYKNNFYHIGKIYMSDEQTEQHYITPISISFIPHMTSETLTKNHNFLSVFSI